MFFSLRSDYVSNFVMNLSETFVCIIYIVDFTHFNNNIRIRDQFLSSSTKCYYLSARYQWCRAQIRIRHTRLSVSPITGYMIQLRWQWCRVQSHTIKEYRWEDSRDIACHKNTSKNIWKKPHLDFFGTFLYHSIIYVHVYIKHICTHIYIT